MANEKGVWRTIGGRRVFIKEGQDLASAMKESGKFKSASKGTAKKPMTEEEKAKKINETMDRRSEVIDRLDKETYGLDNYDRYNLAVSKLENTEGMRPTERQYWAGIKERYEKGQKANSDREALRNTEKEYGELSKKMQADDYYYKPEDDRKLKELRAKADSERARQGIDTQEKYDKLMSEDSKASNKEQFSVSDLKKKAQATLPKEDIDTHEGDLYLKKTKESTELLNNMKDKDSGLLTTFKDQETGETWYDIPFANMGDDYKEKTWRDKIKDSNTRNEILDKELDESTKSKTKEFWNKEDSNGTDLNKFNDKAKAKFGKIDYNGTGRKVNDVEIEMELKDGVFRASGSIKNARGTDSLSGGQNIDEIADLMKDNKDVQEIRDLWHKYHLNHMHAGTEKQEDALMKKFGNRNASDYGKHVEYLKSVGLYEDDGYKYGTGWLKREIPDNDKRRIISLIDKYNGKNTNTETSNKTTNQSMNDALRNAFNDYRKKHKNSNMSFTEFMRINKK